MELRIDQYLDYGDGTMIFSSSEDKKQLLSVYYEHNSGYKCEFGDEISELKDKTITFKNDNEIIDFVVKQLKDNGYEINTIRHNIIDTNDYGD